jgi:hypothetical protein
MEGSRLVVEKLDRWCKEPHREQALDPDIDRSDPRYISQIDTDTDPRYRSVHSAR